MTARRSIDVEMFTLAAAHLRKRAKDKKWLDYPPPVFRCPQDARDLWERAHARFFSSEKLLNRLKAFEPSGVARLKQVSIFHGDASDGFNRTVLPAVEAIMAQTSVVGVTWGR